MSSLSIVGRYAKLTGWGMYAAGRCHEESYVKPFHLAWFLNGYKPQAWGMEWSSPDGTSNDPTFYIDCARALERAFFDFLLIEDSSFICDAYGGSMEVYLRRALMTPKNDPGVLAAILTQATTRLGIVPTLSTSEYPPYLLARLVSTLDHASAGRSGWNIVTGSSDRAAQNYGREALPDHDERYVMAHEFTDLVTRLWDSWESDAIINDPARGVYADPEKVHPLHFRGTYFNSRGPLITSRPPQGRPVIVQAGGSESGRAFAARWADVVVGYERTADAMRAFREDMRRRVELAGRQPDNCRILFLMTPILAETDLAAQQRVEAALQRRLKEPETAQAMMGFTTNIDFSGLDLDLPVRVQVARLMTNGHRSVLDSFLRRAGDRTLRQVLAERQTPQSVGAPASVADELGHIMEDVGGDGFLLTVDDLTRRSMAEVTEGLVPALQKRGLVRTSYSGVHLRDHIGSI